MKISPALLATTFALVQVTSAAPAPQGGSATCDANCSRVLSAAQTCSSEPAATQGSCLCSTSGFVTSAKACIDCGGGNIFTTSSALATVEFAVQGCEGTTSVALPSDIIPVTESAGQPVSIAAWAPSGFTPVGTFNIAATGGDNTTIAQIRTTTVTTASTTSTATGTAVFVLGPSDILLVEGSEGYDDLVYCQLLNETTGDCIELRYDGTSVTASTEFTLVGATSTWVVYPVSGTAVASEVSDTGSAILTSPTQTAASGSNLVGSVAGLPTSTQAVATSASSG